MFQDGPRSLGKSAISHFRSLYLFAIGLFLYLVFDGKNHRLHHPLPSMATYLVCILRDITLYFAVFQLTSLFALTSPCGLHSRLYPVRSPLLRISLLVSFPSFTKRLQFKEYLSETDPHSLHSGPLWILVHPFSTEEPIDPLQTLLLNNKHVNPTADSSTVALLRLVPDLE